MATETPGMVCGPTTGCGQTTPMVPTRIHTANGIEKGWQAPAACRRCGKPFGFFSLINNPPPIAPLSPWFVFASSLGEPVSQEAPGLPPGEFQRALEYVEVATRSEGTRDAEATELLALAASAQRIVDDADRTHHSLGRFDLDNPSGRAGGNTSLHALSKILPLARRVAERALRDTSRSAFSGIPRTENEPYDWEGSYTMLRDALDANLGEFIRDGEEAEEYLYVQGIERAASMCRAANSVNRVEG